MYLTDFITDASRVLQMGREMLYTTCGYQWACFGKDFEKAFDCHLQRFEYQDQKDCSGTGLLNDKLKRLSASWFNQ